MTTPATQNQVPEHSILDVFGKQSYLGNQFVTVVNGIALAGTTETPLILIQNPPISTSAFPSKYKAIFLNAINTSASASTVLRFYFNPTVITLGTLQVAQNLRPASPTTSVSIIYTSPTVSANGTLINAIVSQLSTVTVDDQILILDPGQSLLVTATSVSSGTIIYLQKNFYEL